MTDKQNLREARVTVIGLGIEGVDLVRFLAGEGARVTVSDRRSPEELRDALQAIAGFDVRLSLGANRVEDATSADTVFVSQGVPSDNPAVAAAIEAGVPIGTMLGLFLDRCPAPVAGITGSAGKTTTTALVGEMCRAQGLDYVVGGNIVTYLNVEADTLKDVAMRSIVDGEPVWFGCDVGKMMQRQLGLWDKRMFEFDALYDTEFSLDKAGRLDYHDTLMTHAMLFTGVDVADGKPRRWRVENSWGEENGLKGFFVMNDNWFADYTFEIAARRSYLPQALQDALAQEPIVLPAWDPMGALAR